MTTNASSSLSPASREGCIVLLTAGIGSRLGTITEKRNKCLLSINNQAILTRILDSLPTDVPVVVGLGHFGEHVRNFLEVAHPERRFVFKNIEPYEGKGSSSGFSLYSMRELVPGPFLFCTNDTIVRQQVKFEGRNWLGVALSDDIEKYTTVSVFGTKVKQVFRKGEVGGALAYVGLAEIHDAEAFWASLGAALRARGECSDIEGLFGLLAPGLHAQHVSWVDTGSKDRYDRAVTELGASSHLPKDDEDLYFRNSRVIKFFTDAKKARQRVERNRILGELVPPIVDSRDCFYAYPWTNGEMLTDVLTPALMRRFLAWADERLWIARSIPPAIDAESLTRDFYGKKTQARLKHLFASGYADDVAYTINGTPCQRATELLELLGDEFYGDSILKNFHGDLHPDNILVVPDARSFVLLDWRENFGGCLEVGDQYYDLAKMIHGLYVSHDFVRAEQYRVAIADRTIEIDIPVHYRNLECIDILEEWAAKKGLSIARLRTVVALIYLNIAPLHHYPYNQFLFFLGLRLMQRALDTKRS